MDMDRQRSERKLDFHAPLLSTRRPGRIIVPREKWDMDSSSGFDDRVPFSWEQSPGKPKEILIRSRKNQEFILPLKPPPIRIRPSSKHSSSNEDDDDGCDGDIDDEDGDFFSGGLDLFSLAESSENSKVKKKNSKVNKKSRRRAPPTPSYMMERFLPAAVALAASSSSYFTMEASETTDNGLGGVRGYDSDDATASDGRTSRVAGGGKRVSSPLAFKSCGLEILLPWRARPKKNVVRGPFRFGCSDWKPQLSPRPK